MMLITIGTATKLVHTLQILWRCMLYIKPLRVTRLGSYYADVYVLVLCNCISVLWYLTFYKAFDVSRETADFTDQTMFRLS